MKSNLRNAICIPVFLMLGLTTLQSQFTITSNDFNESYSNIDLNINTTFQFESLMSNITNDTLLINWEVLEANHPEEWIITVSDLQISYILDNIINFNDGIPTHPLVFTPNLLNANYNLAFNPRMVDGCGDVSIKVFNFETNEIYDTLTYSIKINVEDCDLVSTDYIFTSQNKVNVYPSPTHDFINLAGIKPLSEVEITNSNGQLILYTKVVKHEKIDISDLHSGVYFVRIINNHSEFEIHKIIKQ